jgi:hypothetical protein
VIIVVLALFDSVFSDPNPITMLLLLATGPELTFAASLLLATLSLSLTLNVFTEAMAAAMDMWVMKDWAAVVMGVRGCRGKDLTPKKITVRFMPCVNTGTAMAVRTSEMAVRRASVSCEEFVSVTQMTWDASLARLQRAGDRRWVLSLDLLP